MLADVNKEEKVLEEAMKKLFFGFVFAALSLGMTGIASADHRHYSGCGHKGYGYHRSYYQTPVYADYWHNHFYQGRKVRCHYYGGRHHYSYRPAYVPQPVYVAPVYPNYWHDHYYRGRHVRCHYYSGRHHYGHYYRPQTRFHFGISIFR